MRCIPLSVVALAAGLAGQSVVSPSWFTSVEGNFFDSSVGSTTTMRILQVHDDLRGSARTLNAMSFRPDRWYAGQARGGNAPAFSIVADIACSTAAVAANAVSSTFAANHGPDRVQVASMRQYNFPFVPHGTLPGDWSYAMPFSQSFGFGGGNGLCWEIVVHGRTNTNGVVLDGAYGGSSFPGPMARSVGGGCTSTGEAQPIGLFGGPSTINWTNSVATYHFLGSALPRSSVATLAIGLSSTNWSGLPLPYVLPGSASAPSGPCSVVTDWTLQVPMPTTANGTIDYTFPGVPVFHGATLFGQLVAFDAAANPWGLVTSNGEEVQAVAPYAAPSFGVVTASNDMASVGVAQPAPLAAGLVVKFD